MLRRLITGTGLSLAQAEDKFVDVWQEFERVKGNYSGVFSVFRKHIKTEDKESLVGCIDGLLLLDSEDLVQIQLRRTENPRETLHYKIRELDIQIFEYLANFMDSGDARLGVKPRVYQFLLG